jgi:sister chromatid cohesion protein PDS5
LEYLLKSPFYFSIAEKSWLRLGAGCAMLKICEQKGVGDQFNATQFFNLSHLMQVIDR